MNEKQRLSRLLFHAREVAEMYVDVIESATGKVDVYLRTLVHEIDSYRAEQGWSLDGYGGESDDEL